MIRFTALPLTLAALSLVLAGGGCAGGGNSLSTENVGGQGQIVKSDVITINSPAENSTITSPVRIEGVSQHPEAPTYARVIDTDGSMKVEAKVMTDASGKFDFSAVYIFFATGPDMVIEVFEKDENGNQVNKTSIPVKYSAE